ncbi:hypothetical protein HYC85_013480 [Camellia sinensis]|uniref:Uncharacterized protein n=1 Tax=Camellia sinensis TaxID=4442 RepID=A0A7J7H3G8_CAMSI|nr:hypothetical protein HYC85_013480 [Camellia sinensis]
MLLLHNSPTITEKEEKEVEEKRVASEIKVKAYIQCSLVFLVHYSALRLLSRSETNDEKWLETRNRLLQGSAHLLGLLVWRVQRDECNSTEKGEILCKLEIAKREIEGLKRVRSEDAKANDKVVGIFASREQSWLSERKKLQRQIGALLNELRVMQTKRDKSISELNDKLEEKACLLRSKKNLMELEEKKRSELEEKLNESVKGVEELRENAKCQAQEHSLVIWKHKTAFIELVSNHRQLEAEMGRALKQIEAAKQELESVLEQKDESVLMARKLSMDLIKTQKDLEQKDKILSAMLRKSKLDSEQKQMLLKEVKLLKAKRKQAEVETERWKAVSESRRDRHSLKSMMFKHSSSKSEALIDGRGARSNAMVPSQSGWSRTKTTDFLPEEHQKEMEVIISPLYEQYSPEGNEELDDVKHPTLKGLTMIYHNSARECETGSFVNLLKQQLEPLSCQKTDLNSFSQNQAMGYETVWSKVNIIKRKPGDKEQETNSMDISQEVEHQKEEESSSTRQSKDIILTVQSPEKEFEEEKDVALDPSSIREFHASPEEVDIVENSASSSQCSSKSIVSPWKMDLHALGVSYKIKRLKQLLLMIEQLIGKHERCEDREGGDDNVQAGIKGLHILMSLLNKQVSRYESLQGKIDELCKRMHEKDLDVMRGGSSIAKTKEEIRTLEQFLEETFQLQRYIVATGQKLTEIQSKIASGFVEAMENIDGPADFDMKRFADNVRTFFREVQRGLEIRIARFIGDLEGTLACDGIIHLRK